jgi:hypothetical protein
MCAYLDWDVTVDFDCFRQLDILLWADFMGLGPYRDTLRAYSFGDHHHLWQQTCPLRLGC